MPQVKPKTVGRPKLHRREVKGGFVVVRFNADDLKRINGAAKSKNQTTSEWVRSTLLEMARG